MEKPRSAGHALNAGCAAHNCVLGLGLQFHVLRLNLERRIIRIRGCIETLVSRVEIEVGLFTSASGRTGHDATHSIFTPSGQVSVAGVRLPRRQV